MGFSFRLERTNNYEKLKNKYNRDLEVKKKNLNNQIEKLNSQLKNNLIDQFTYERHKVILEVHSSLAHDIKQQEEALKNINQHIN